MACLFSRSLGGESALGHGDERELRMGAGANNECTNFEKPFGGRGNVYRWLRTHYAFVTEWMAREQPSWETVAAKMAREGVVGTKGQPPTRRSAWKVWQRVCRDIDLARKRNVDEEAERQEREYELLTGVRREQAPRDFPGSLTQRLVEPVGKSLVPGALQESSLPVSAVPLGPDGKPLGSLARAKRNLENSSGRAPLLTIAEACARMSKRG